MIKLPQFWFEPVANRFEDTCLVALIGDAVFTTVGAGTCVFLGLHERSLGNDGNSFLGLLSISTKDRDRGSSSRRSMNSRRRTIRNEVSTVLVRSGGERVRARSFLHDRSGSGGCSSLRLLYTLLLRVSSKNRDLSSSSGGCVDSCLYLFICVYLACSRSRERECVAYGGSVGDKVTTVLIGACSEGIR